MKRITSIHKRLIAPMIALVLSGGVLLTSVLSLASMTFGWFSRNQVVSATSGGMNALAKEATLEIAYGTYEDGAWTYGDYAALKAAPTLNLSTFSIPGVATRFRLRIHNITDDTAIMVTELGFAKYTDANEVPVEIDDVNYYLGTQLTACLVNGDPEEKTTPVALASYQGNTHTLTDATAVALYTGSTEIQPDGTAIWTVELRFVNKDEDQNAYADFAGTCTRQVYFEIK